jgi:hypothetical protein
VIKIRLENAEGSLFIKLPVYPSTIEELALIRFWLLKLSQIHFEYLYAEAYALALFCLLSPKFLSVLNPRTGPRKIQFHANNVGVVVGDHETAILADFAQFICARRMTLYTSLLDEPLYRNNIFRFITGTGNSLEKFHINSFEPNQGEFCEFLVKVNIGNSFL